MTRWVDRTAYGGSVKRTDLALAALASAAVPGMKPVTVARMSVERGAEAELEQAVVEDATGRRWLVRSPLTPVAGARLHRNDELVRQLARHLPFKVPAAAGYAAVGREGHAAVYPHVEGATLDFARLPAGAGLAHAVGRAVAAVHNIPAPVFEEQDVPCFDAAGWRQRLIAEVDRAAETGRVPTRLLARWEEAFDASPLWQFASTPVHGSFRGATVVVAFADQDADSGRVVAVTDWDEAMVADPATDLADVYSQASPEAWESVLDSYALARAQRPDPYLHARARLLSETARLRGLAQHVASGDEEATRRIVEGLRRMDRLNEDEDSLVPATARGAAAATTVSATEVPATPASEAAVRPSTEQEVPPEAPADEGGWMDDDVDPGEAAVDPAGGGPDERDDDAADAPDTDEGLGGDDLEDDLIDLDEDDEDDDVGGRGAAQEPDPYLDDGEADPHPDDEPSPTAHGAHPVGEDGLDEADITAEVPVVRLDGPGQEAPPTEPAVAGPTTTVDAVPSDQDAASVGPAGPPQPDASGRRDRDADPDAELLDDDTRLQELYGMPAEDDPRS